MKIYHSATLALYDMVVDVTGSGKLNDARGMPNRELTSKNFVLADPRNRIVDIPSRPIRNDYNAASVCYNIAQRNDVNSISKWNPNGKKISDDGVVFYGANYGQRWADYLEEAIYLLSNDPDSRRAFVPVWRPEDSVNEDDPDWYYRNYSRNGKDVPCTVGFGLRIIDGCLVMQTIMRSQSVIGVMCYDVFLFTALQELIANELKVPLGWYEHHMMSAHVYEREVDIVKQIIGAGQPEEPDSMAPLRYDYSSAKIIYPMAYNAISGGVIEDVTDEMYSDPIISMLASSTIGV